MSLSKLNINFLPNEILVEIFSKLEAPQASICMMVNKRWNDILKEYRIGIRAYNNIIQAAAEWAAYNGYLDLLKFAKIDFGVSILCQASAHGGQLKVLKWARENGCPWNEWTCEYAASGGHLEVLKWARKNGCPWNEWTCYKAAYGGYLEVLKWARENRCPWDNFKFRSV